MEPNDIRQLAPPVFKARLAELQGIFEGISRDQLAVAKLIQIMKSSCPHGNSESRPHARYCNDCGEYYAVNTSFSPGA